MRFTTEEQIKELKNIVGVMQLASPLYGNKGLVNSLRRLEKMITRLELKIIYDKLSPAGKASADRRIKEAGLKV